MSTRKGGAYGSSNVSGLFLVRTVSRRKEMAVRLALGAGQWRIFRVLMMESGFVALIAGAGGLALAAWGLKTLISLGPGDIPQLKSVAVDGSTLVAALASSAIAAIVIGMVPAWRASTPRLDTSLKDGGRDGTDARRTLLLCRPGERGSA